MKYHCLCPSQLVTTTCNRPLNIRTLSQHLIYTQKLKSLNNLLPVFLQLLQKVLHSPGKQRWGFVHNRARDNVFYHSEYALPPYVYCSYFLSLPHISAGAILAVQLAQLSISWLLIVVVSSRR